MARLLASVALAVNTTPAGVAPTRRATLARAPSREARASSPRECGAEGLPTPPSRNGRMSATTRGSTGEKPAQSRYTRVTPEPVLASLSEEETVDRAIPLDLQELVTRAGHPAGHVGFGRRVVGGHLEDLADGHLLHCIAGFEHRHRAKEPDAVEFVVSQDAHISR